MRSMNLWPSRCEKFVDLGLLADDGERIRLTREGLFVSDAIGRRCCEAVPAECATACSTMELYLSALLASHVGHSYSKQCGWLEHVVRQAVAHSRLQRRPRQFAFERRLVVRRQRLVVFLGPHPRSAGVA